MPKGNRRSEWREWPKRRALEVRNLPDTTQIHFVLECGHVIEACYRNPGWHPGTTDLMDGRESQFHFACGHCHYNSPAGAVAPDTGRCQFFKNLGGQMALSQVE